MPGSLWVSLYIVIARWRLEILCPDGLQVLVGQIGKNLYIQACIIWESVFFAISYNWRTLHQFEIEDYLKLMGMKAPNLDIFVHDGLPYEFMFSFSYWWILDDISILPRIFGGTKNHEINTHNTVYGFLSEDRFGAEEVDLIGRCKSYLCYLSKTLELCVQGWTFMFMPHSSGKHCLQAESFRICYCY